MKKYSVTIKNNIKEVRVYTTTANNVDDALAKVERQYRFTTDNLPIVEVEIKEI